jgi:hypothetical protein
MEDQLGLQGEENLKTSQQAQNRSPYDPSAAARFPDGYTPVDDVSITTPVEDAPLINVGEVEVTASIDFSNPVLESFGSSGDTIIPTSITPAEAFKAYGIDITPVEKNDNPFNLDTISFGSGNIVDDSIVVGDLPEQEQVVDPPAPPVDPPIDPPVEPPVDPEDPENPDPEDPEEPDPGKGNPGNDKEVGNSPWDGETGASDNPGKGNHQDGQDPEPNQPPGDSKNDGGQNNDSENPPGNGGGGGKPDNHQDNGWGNGDDTAPGNSGPHNNAENDASPSEHYDDFIGRFIEQNPGDHWYQDVTYNWEQDNDSFLDYIDQPVFPHEVPELPHFDHLMDHFDHSM